MFVPKQMYRVYLAMSILFLWPALPDLSSAQSSDECNDARAQQAWDDASSPVYADATELARTLSDRGFVVKCIRRSKEEHLFEGQKGAAWYKTDQGIFEVWFLPKLENFVALDIIAQPQGNGRYTYFFRGTPRISTTMDSSKPISFIKYGNLLFEVWGDKQLAGNLSHALQKP